MISSSSNFLEPLKFLCRDRPEFHDAEKIRSFVRTFEDKVRLHGLLERTVVSGGVQVLVGSEAQLLEVPDVGVISAQYKSGGVQGAVL